MRETLKKIKIKIINSYGLNYERIGAVDGLRAIAILMVFNVHFWGFYGAANYFVPTDSILYYLINILRAGHLGVDLFFVISGYLIYGSLRSGPVNVNFFYKRFARLFPVHFLVCLYAAKGYSGLGILYFIANILFIATIYPTIPLLNGVTWSLTWEWYFYAFVFISVLLSSNPKKSLLYLILITLTFSIVNNIFFDNNILFQCERFLGFVFGVMLYIFRNTKLFSESSEINFYLGLIGFLFIFTLQFLWANYAGQINTLPLEGGFYILVSLAFVVILKSTITPGSGFNEIFSKIPLRFLGKISYSFYMTHSIIIAEVLNRLPVANSLSGVVIRYAFVFSLTTLVSTFLYYYLERPYFNWRKQRNLDKPLKQT